MNKKLSKLAEQRMHLVAEIASQRVLLSQNMMPLRASLALADKGLAIVRYIKNHRLLASSGSVVLLSTVLPNSIGKWSRRAWFVWQILRKLRH